MREVYACTSTATIRTPWIDLSELGLGQTRLLFTGDLVGGVTALQIGPFALRKRPDVRNPRPWVNGALALGAAVVAVRRLAR